MKIVYIYIIVYNTRPWRVINVFNNNYNNQATGVSIFDKIMTKIDKINIMCM